MICAPIFVKLLNARFGQNDDASSKADKEIADRHHEMGV